MATKQDPKAYARGMQQSAQRGARPIDGEGEIVDVLNSQPTGTALVKASDMERSLGIAPRKLDATEAASFVNTLVEEYELSPNFVKLTEGDVIRGQLVGEGAVDIADKDTGEVKRVRTWILQDERGMRAQILSAHQLESEFADRDGRANKLGRWVIIARMNDERIPGRTRVVTRYRVGFKREGAAGVERAS